MRYFTFPLGVILVLFLGAPFLLFIADFFSNKQIGQNLITTLIASGMGSWAGAWFVWHKTQEEKQEEILSDINALAIELLYFEKYIADLNDNFLRPLRKEIYELYRNCQSFQLGEANGNVVPAYVLEQRLKEYFGKALNDKKLLKYAYLHPQLCSEILFLRNVSMKLDDLLARRNKIITDFLEDTEIHQKIEAGLNNGDLRTVDSMEPSMQVVAYKLFYLSGCDVFQDVRDTSYRDVCKGIKASVQFIQLRLPMIKVMHKKLAHDALSKKYYKRIVEL